MKILTTILASAFLTLATHASIAQAQGPPPNPSVPPLPGMPFTANSVPASQGRYFAMNRMLIKAGLMDALAHVDAIGPSNIQDIRTGNAMSPKQQQGLLRMLGASARWQQMAAQLTQALQSRGLLAPNQAVVAVIGTRVYIVTM